MDFNPVSFHKHLGSIALFVLLSQPVSAGFEEDYEQKAWQEMQFQFPPAPRSEALLPFFVSAANDNKFAVDAASLTVGEDGVVRYILLVETAGGARNVSYEGIRCQTKERRIYALGRRDGTWSKSRNDQWVEIRDMATNRQHAALFLEYFCPGGVIVRNADEAKNALRAGVHPHNRW